MLFLLLFVRAHAVFSFFFFNDTATTEIYTLSLHDALPILRLQPAAASLGERLHNWRQPDRGTRSEEHTSELQSPDHLVCRLLLEKKKKHMNNPIPCEQAASRQESRTHARPVMP